MRPIVFSIPRGSGPACGRDPQRVALRVPDLPYLACLPDATPKGSRYLNQLAAVETGSVTRKRVPLELLYKSMRPSCASTIFLTIGSPSPEPCGLVVKNGLKIRSVSSGGTPGPLLGASPITTAARPRG